MGLPTYVPNVRAFDHQKRNGKLVNCHFSIRLVNLGALQDFHHLEALYQLATRPAKGENIRATLAFMSAE